jgi:release factor glutamine methyltransferase
VYAEDEANLLLAETSTPDALEDLVVRRERGEPLEYVIGWAEFCGLRIAVEPGVFVPRRRTELLAHEAAEVARAVASSSHQPVVVDLCCGSGALGAVIAAEFEVDLYAVDVDPTAVQCARRNLPGATVLEGDLYAPLPRELRGRVDVIVANAPYVPTAEIPFMPTEARLYEAPVALDGGVDGLDVHRRIAADATQWLSPGGHLVIEVAQAQESSAIELMTESGLSPVGPHWSPASALPTATSWSTDVPDWPVIITVKRPDEK